MLLSVPLMVLMKLIFSQDKRTEIIARIMSSPDPKTGA